MHARHRRGSLNSAESAGRCSVLALEARPPQRPSEPWGASPAPPMPGHRQKRRRRQQSHSLTQPDDTWGVRAGRAGDRDGVGGFPKAEGGEGEERERRGTGTGSGPAGGGGHPALELQSRLRRSHFGCRQLTGTIAGRVGYGDAGKLTPFLTSN